MKEIIKHCLTGPDGVTYDPARVYLSIAVMVYLAGAIAHIWYNKSLDFQSFGIGFGSLMLGGGLGIAAKSKTEPSA